MNNENDDVIFSYSREEAIEDGVLVDVSPYGCVNTITQGVAELGYVKDGQIDIPCIVDLNMIVHKYISTHPRDTLYSIRVQCPDGKNRKFFIAENETGRFTAMLPEEY